MTEQPDPTAELEDALTDALATIRRYWPDLLVLEPASGGRGGPSTADTLTATERTISLRQDVARVLLRWCRVIIRDRPLTMLANLLQGEHVKVGARRYTHVWLHSLWVDELLDLLERHASWFAGHPAASQAVRQIERAARNVELVAEPPDREVMRLGPCPFLIVDADTPASAVEHPVPIELQPVWECRGWVVTRLSDLVYAHCTGCGKEAVIEWWEDVLGLRPRPVTLPKLPKILHDRLGLRVSERHLRRWRDAGIIRALPEPGDPGREDEIGPRPQWDRFDPRQVTQAVVDMAVVCRVCGDPWDGAGEVCRACSWASYGAKPERVDEVEGPRVAGIPVTLRPKVLQPEVLSTIHDRPDDEPIPWCDYGDLPADMCACGNPNAQHPKRGLAP